MTISSGAIRLGAGRGCRCRVRALGDALGPDDGEAIWFNGALGLLKATAEQSEGRFTAFELRLPK